MSSTSNAAEQLHEEQTEKLAEVEVKVKEELRETEAELEKELDSTKKAVDQQMEMQKQLVSLSNIVYVAVGRAIDYQLVLQSVFSTSVSLLCFRFQALENQKNKFEREMAAKQRSLSQEEYEKLLAQHKKDLAALESNLDKEKSRQHQSLQEKVSQQRFFC